MSVIVDHLLTDIANLEHELTAERERVKVLEGALDMALTTTEAFWLLGENSVYEHLRAILTPPAKGPHV